MSANHETDQRALPSIVERLLTEIELSEVLNRKRSTLHRDRKLAIGVPYVKVGRHVRYRLSDVERYLAAL